MDLVDLLSEGKVEEFNAARGRRAAPDLFAADLAGLNLAGVDFSGVNLEKADLSGSNLRGAVLARTRLDGADLTGADLTGVMAVKSRWKEAFLGDAVLDNADFSGADLSGAVLTGAHGEGVVLRGARLREIEGMGLRLPGADLCEARLDKADLSGAQLADCQLVEAGANGANFKGANLDGAKAPRFKATGASFEQASLKGATLTGADLVAAKLGEADFSRADLSGADLFEAEVAGATFEGANLRGARLPDAELAGAPPEEEAPADIPPQLVFDEPSVATNGDVVMVLWENLDDEEKHVLRVMRLGSSSAPAIPLALEPMRARGLAAEGAGFVAVLLMERSSGWELLRIPIDAKGKPGKAQGWPLEYEPAVAPVVTSDGKGPVLLGLGRNGPRLFAHRVTAEGPVRLWSEAVNTARGILGEDPPVLVTRGGILRCIRPEGLGPIVQEPGGFSARAASACVLEGRLLVAWTNPQGAWTAELAPGQKPDPELAVKDKGVGNVALGPTGELWFTREEGRHSALWSLRPGGKPTRILDAAMDIDTVRVLPNGRLLCTTMDERLLLVSAAGKVEVEVP